MDWRVKTVFGLTRWMVAIIAIVAVGLIMWLVALSLVGDKTEEVENRLNNNQADAAIESARDAVTTYGDQVSAESRVDDVSKENEHDIRNAEGADAPVPSAVHDAGLRSLCKRAAYSSHPSCVQRTSAP